MRVSPSPFLFLALALACAAPRPAEAPAPDAARLAADVAWLADPAREGRRAGTQAALEAGEWLAARLAELGLEPAGEPGLGNGYLQRFEVPLDPRSGGRSWLEGEPFGRLEEARGVLAPLFCAELGTASGEPVFCGFGIESEAHGWNDFEGLELEGRIAVLLRGAPPLPAAQEAPKTGEPTPAAAAPVANPHGDAQLVGRDAWGGAASVFVKVMNAKRRGAAAVVLLPDPAASEEGLLEFDGASPARAGLPCVTAVFPRGLDRERLARIARTEPAARAELAQGAGLVEGGISGPWRVHADVVRARGEATNVLARVKGKRPGKSVLVGAHYDHLGHGGTGSLAPGARGEIHHGADDNASGTAVALELARLFAARPPERGELVIALWSGEELGLLGSEHWAVLPSVPLEQIALCINLDMVGRAGESKLVVLGAGSAAPLADWVRELGARTRLALEVVGSGQGVGGSDHQTFLKREIPAVHFFSGLHADYHRPTDTADRFQAEGAAEVTALAASLARRALEQADELVFVAPPAREEGRQIQSGFNAWFGSIPSYAFEGPGVLFDGISPASPAERAGLLQGDVLRRLGDVAIDTIYDFTYALQRYKAGDVVRVVYLRDGLEQELSITLSSRGVK